MFTRRALSLRLLAASLGVSAVMALLPAAASAAETATWEFFEPRYDQLSPNRKRPVTFAIEFDGVRVAPGRSWGRLSDDDRAAVVRAQAKHLKPGMEPPYPKVGTEPLIERLRRVRGPVGQTLRLNLEIDTFGRVDSIASETPVSQQFLGDMLQLLLNSSFKTASCGGEKCTGVITMDLVYLGEPD